MSDLRGTRRKAREAALSFLYQRDLNESSVTLDPVKFVSHFGLEEDSREFFMRIVRGIPEVISKIDIAISNTAENWKLSRMESIDRCILRIGVWELMECPETDYQVIIDEAIELAKEFGSENSPAFVNGLLDKLSELRKKN
jgi:N utilization substance protein B